MVYIATVGLKRVKQPTILKRGNDRRLEKVIYGAFINPFVN
jgi:hypothetical protein